MTKAELIAYLQARTDVPDDAVIAMRVDDEGWSDFEVLPLPKATLHAPTPDRARWHFGYRERVTLVFET